MKKAALMMIVALTISVFANAQTKVEIKSADLPKAITENVTKDYSGYTIQNAFKVTTNKETSYQVIVVKGTDKEKLAYSSTGAFVKKTPVVAKSAKKAPEKKAPAKKAPAKEKAKVEAKPQTTVAPTPAPVKK